MIKKIFSRAKDLTISQQELSPIGLTYTKRELTNDEIIKLREEIIEKQTDLKYNPEYEFL